MQFLGAAGGAYKYAASLQILWCLTQLSMLQAPRKGPSIMQTSAAGASAVVSNGACTSTRSHVISVRHACVEPIASCHKSMVLTFLSTTAPKPCIWHPQLVLQERAHPRCSAHRTVSSQHHSATVQMVALDGPNEHSDHHFRRENPRTDLFEVRWHRTELRLLEALIVVDTASACLAGDQVPSH